MPSLQPIGRLKRTVERARKRKLIDCVDLGCGPLFGELLKFAQKPGRKLYGIDRVFKEGFAVRGRRSKIKIIAGDILEKVKNYKPDSVKHFRMTMVLSSFPGEWLDPRNDRCLFAVVAEHIHRVLVPNGRFRIVDKKAELEKAAEILKRAGFKISKIRRLKKTEISTGWASRYAAFGEADWPHALVAVKRVK